MYREYLLVSLLDFIIVTKIIDLFLPLYWGGVYLTAQLNLGLSM